MNFIKSIRLAEEGDAEAQYKLAEMYWSGHGATVDTDKAWYWCNRAAQQGHSKATGLLSLLQREITEGRVCIKT